MTTAAIIVAAGKGERAGGGVPKQFQLLSGKALVAHCVDAFAAHPAIDHIVIVLGAGQDELLAQAVSERMVSATVTGGDERQDSVRCGLGAAAALGCDKVLIHDAARPFIPTQIVDALLKALETSPGAVPAIPVVDTLARGDALLGAPEGREGLFRIQTPQAFHLDAIMTSHKTWTRGPATDDAQMARAAGFDVAIVPGAAELEKITQPGDLARIEAQRMKMMDIRTGMGFDVHRLETGEELWLCGVRIPHDRGLSGHSDADVALHALTDALLGAVSEGDIGTHFPPSDPQWCGAPSSCFLEHARNLIAAKGGVISHVDVTIICEAPKIAPHRDAMRARVAELLQLSLDRISIKATTTERLGFTGREEGIAAQAIATVRL
jgi:2-C-methyl-D-erythritol 4-phosphate cytidylyltransferase / 2-C-methyl-D-erythritol 2,4-cyclodiphosphate synthase